MNIKTILLREKILNEYESLREILDTRMQNSTVETDTFLDYSEYFFIRSRIYICFHDFSEYIDVNEKVTDFLLELDNASDFMTYIFINGLAGDCDPKSVEGIVKLMIFSYNHAVFRKGKRDFIPVEVSF